MNPTTVLEFSLIAATIPFVLCIFAAFSPSSKIRNIGDYYLYDRELDIDSFLKSTVGYSLQVAAIALFISWGFSYGLRSTVVCVAWGAGYFLVALLLHKKKFESFLGTARPGIHNNTGVIATIHGYIHSRLDSCPLAVGRATILIVSLASVIGLGGTMLTEIFYATSFFTSAIGIENPGLPLETTIHLFILFFALLYVLWGGFKASVFIDRFQTPIAYVAFGVFALGGASVLRHTGAKSFAFWIVVGLAVIYASLLFGRLNLLRKVMPDALWNKTVSYLTFAPLIFLSLGCAILLGKPDPKLDLYSVLIPKVNAFMGFGAVGVISLIVTNAIWQLIDISSLQRLQSLDVQDVSHHRPKIVRALRWIGIETALGWTIIVAAALILKIGGFSISDDRVSTIFSEILKAGASNSFLLPLFIFTVVVFMVSTVSCFISALSYIARYDIAPALNLLPDGSRSLGAQELIIARITTLIVVGALYTLYAIFVAGIGHDSIATVLYAVYAFQVAITPSALTALFLPKRPVNPWAAIASTISGMYVAWWTATRPAAPSWLAFVGNESWYVFPPIAVIFTSCTMYLLILGVFETGKKLLPVIVSKGKP